MNCKLPDDRSHQQTRCDSCSGYHGSSNYSTCVECRDFRNQKELDVVKYLRVTDDLSEFIHNKVCSSDGKKYRPDILYYVGTHVVIVEVDEGAHKAYSALHSGGDSERMNNIARNMGCPVVFIRYNPDKYYVHGKRLNSYPSFVERMEKLCSLIRFRLQDIPVVGPSNMLVDYLYYDVE